MTGRLNSFLSMSALDGDGVRCVAFLQGCPLRCAYCHNPEAWDLGGGTEITPAQLLERVSRYKNYFGDKGGVTLSGGEVLVQAEFAAEFFRLCHQKGINTAIETSGCIINEGVEKLLAETDCVLLDVKFTDEGSYRKNTGGSLEQTLRFLNLLHKVGKRTVVRQVIVPGLNDSAEQVQRLKDLCTPYSCIEKIQLLPFRKLCSSKYDELGLRFPLAHTPEASPELIYQLEKILDK